MRKKSVASAPWLNTGTIGVTPYHCACMVQIDAPLSVQVVQSVCNQSEIDCSDELLLRAVTKKDGRAFEILYERHASFVYNRLVWIVHNEGVAEELLQETFWQVWQKASQYSGVGAAIAWIHQIARHKALDQLRGQKVRPTVLANNIETLEWAVQHEPSAESEFEQNWTRQQVRQALEQIPYQQRLCLELAYFEGLSYQAIAEQTNTPLGTIKTRIRIGIKKLERELVGRGYIGTLPTSRHFTASEGN